MASEHVKEASDGNFEQEVLKNPLPVLIDFWAEWCGPCRALGPTVDALAKDYAGKVAVYKMNVDENQGVPVQYGVRSIPTLILFKAGQKVDQILGSVPRATLEDAIKKVL
ncbi:MAG: thioredoxin [Deltaproteobacteria bacterium]|nr:thioredoxin [Deltaproteobacteria bacterium]